MIFWVLLALVVVSLIGIFAFIGLWVYNDAKKRGEKPLIWVLIALFVPNFFGLIIYLLIGRKGKFQGFKNKFKVPLIAMVVTFVVSISAFISYVVIANDIPIISGVSIGMVENNIGDKWKISFKSSGKELKRSVKFTEEELDNFHVSSSCEKGSAFLYLMQKDKVKVVDLTDFDGKVDLKDFEAGKVKLIIINHDAKNAKVDIRWE